MTQSIARTIAGAAVLALVSGPMAVSNVSAQSAQQGSPQAGPEAFSEGQLKAFAMASLEIQELNEKWQPRITDAEDWSEKNDLQKEARQEMVDAVGEAGLTVQNYNQIHQATQVDPETAQKVQEYWSELR
jgi:hypothetical protein